MKNQSAKATSLESTITGPRIATDKLRYGNHCRAAMRPRFFLFALSFEKARFVTSFFSLPAPLPFLLPNVLSIGALAAKNGQWSPNSPALLSESPGADRTSFTADDKKKRKIIEKELDRVGEQSISVRITFRRLKWKKKSNNLVKLYTRFRAHKSRRLVLSFCYGPDLLSHRCVFSNQWPRNQSTE
ncbi:hypothetical protein PUN28_000975 [Cardiocondyla obscurior]|uniref:Uncharacterized protein n=1 Tax=Cardiocondyla obscurior TaxID=286306 RepID=A0AAW2H2X7_9HYME